MTDKYIIALEEIRNPEIKNGYDLISWQSKAINVIVRIYGEDSIQEEQIKQVKFKTYPSYGVNGQTYGGGNNATFCNKQASEIIQGLISDLSSFGLPEKRGKTKSDGINISLNQHQSQTQTINVSLIWESVKDELTGKQIKELESVLSEEISVEEKKTKTIDKLKSFGSDIITNIIANILTNPAIYGG